MATSLLPLVPSVSNLSHHPFGGPRSNLGITPSWLPHWNGHCPLNVSAGDSAPSSLPRPQPRPPTSLSKQLPVSLSPYRLPPRTLLLENKCDRVCPLLKTTSSLQVPDVHLKEPCCPRTVAVWPGASGTSPKAPPALQPSQSLLVCLCFRGPWDSLICWAEVGPIHPEALSGPWSPTGMHFWVILIVY